MLEPMSAEGLLRDFVRAGFIGLPDYHLARRLSRGFEPSEEVQLAFALTVRELRRGSVCLPLSTARALKPLSEADDGSAPPVNEAHWPEPAGWLRAVAASRLVGPGAPFVLDDDRLYLRRYHLQEQRVRELLIARQSLSSGQLPDEETLLAGSSVPGNETDPQQDEAVLCALRHMTSVLTGGPGTGKTTTVQRVLLALSSLHPLLVALAAPTGKAARQLHDSVVGHLPPGATRGLFTGTLHRMLGIAPHQPHGSFDASNPLPYDVIVVDETSMVSLEQMALLLGAIGRATRLVLVGDPNQLRSVDAGAILADLVANDQLLPAEAVAKLRRNYRSNAEIGDLARLIDEGDAEAALDALRRAPNIDFVPYTGQPIDDLPLREEVVRQAREVVGCAQVGDARGALKALGRHRVLCAHTVGPYGVEYWARAARRIIARDLPGYGSSAHYIGQPLLVTRNSDRFNNGDVAVLCLIDGLQAAVEQGKSDPLIVSPSQLDAAQDLHAMTVHKAQGGGFDRVSVVLPPVGSPLATRELLYTAVTRAKLGLVLYGTEAAFVEAVRTPVRRASGLAAR
ncbi:exodeoxyribonuclease V subunit alpha [Tessaracoccus sp. OH4464_COT-324]|uniref:exodeoxyribonuclease V subunit alpha n=1 Tax=Tessaracoccus sp. OH4464_COT-324 TaxID=2491059 RepID=UPI000F6363C6|nr:exodeoxyribonuclease V subunit alpha [Tessaracoccus sp. OH4464_COT-324]RRD47457.1 exodeoxyribonuclease V subunit alpha [Tessaracoccus sp. OH4464_COT-324]